MLRTSALLCQRHGALPCTCLVDPSEMRWYLGLSRYLGLFKYFVSNLLGLDLVYI